MKKDNDKNIENTEKTYENKEKKTSILFPIKIIICIILIIIIGVVIFIVIRNKTSDQNNNLNNQTSLIQTNSQYWDSILEDADSNLDAYKYPGQSSDNIGIDSSGNPINMDNWSLDEKAGSNGEIILVNHGNESVYTANSSVIIIPEYIYINSVDSFFEVIGIGEGTFSGCTNLKSLTIPQTIDIIEQNALTDCNNLIDVYYNGSMEQWNELDIDYNGNAVLKSATIHCSNGDILP